MDAPKEAAKEASKSPNGSEGEIPCDPHPPGAAPRAVPDGETPAPAESDVPCWTDQYFMKTKAIASRFGDKRVTYAIFMRRPVLFTPRLMVDWLRAVEKERNCSFDIKLNYEEGESVGAGEPLVYLSGSFHDLVDLETLYLQKLGAACVAASNAFQMCVDLPKAAFVANDARHCAGTEMADLMAYAAAMGSEAARKKVGAIGFVGNATPATIHYFGADKALGTMPHALIGYAGSTLRAAEMFHETFPDEPMTVLVDYFGMEITDSLTVCRQFPELAAAGRMAIRLDTHGGRYIEGLDPAGSYDVLDRKAPDSIRGYRTETELRYLVGTGVSAAAIWSLREALDEAGFDKVKIACSSGFGPAKCRVMAYAHAPIDMIGTGSYLPDKWSETYATADIIEYDGEPSVKVGREFLLRRG